MIGKIWTNKAIAIISAIMLIISIMPVALVSATNDSVLVEEVYNISADKKTYAVKEENIQSFDEDKSYLGSGIRIRFGVKNSPLPNSQSKLTWFSESGFESFTVFTNNYKETDMSYLDISASYKFSWSADNITFTDINSVENKGFTILGTSYYSYELCLTNIPKEARYMRLTMISPQASFGWKYAINKVSYKYYAKVPSVTLKSSDGNVINNGDVTDKNVILTTENLKENQISIKKDGQDYAIPAGSLFTENGTYSISAENTANSGNPIVISFEIKKPLIYTLSYSLLNDNQDGAFKVEGDIVTENTNNYENYMNYFNGNYFVHLSNATNATASYYWSSESGFESFTVFTKNEKANISDYLKLEDSYKLFWSKDDVTYNELTYISLGASNSGTGYLSYKLVASYIPDDAKYIRLTLKNPCNEKNWRIGLDGFEYEVLLEKPSFILQTQTSSGQITLGDKSLSGGDVTVSYNYIEESDITVTKNGNSISFPEDAVFTENGEYTLSATNAKGTSTVSFTIKHENPQDFICEYIFDSDETKATATFDSLLNKPAIDGAPKDFANGDGCLVINAESNLNDKWWSYEDGGAKLTLGKGSNYGETGYFYFKNSGSEGKKYTGISFTYSVAAKSGFPQDQKIIISVSDSYNGKFTKLTPVSHTENKTISGSMVKIYTDVYYLGGTDKIVKVEFVANTLITARWHAAALSIFSLSKLQMPIIDVKAVKAVENYGVATQDVNYSVSNYHNYKILRNGEPYTPSVEGVLDEDGDYVIKANNIVGECNWNFTIAKDNPAIILRDSSGAAIASDSVQDNDVTVTVINSKTVTVTRDGNPFKLSQNGVLDLNGLYVITAENESGKITVKKVIIARALPSIDVVDYDGKILSDGAVSNTYIDVMVKKADSVVVKKDEKNISMPDENRFLKNGKYSVEAINKAGSVVFNFTVDIAAPLADMKHSGDTIEVVDYDNSSKMSIYQFATNYMTAAKFPANSLAWIGINSAMLRPEKTALKTSVIYRCNNFKSFGVWAILHPEILDLLNYKIYSSSDGLSFKEISYSVEKDESYISKGTPSQKGYSRYRLIAQNIPVGTNYIKVEIDSQNKLAHAYGIQKVEFSFNKKEQGIIDINELENIMKNSNDGHVIPIVVRNDAKPIPASVFEAFMGFDVTLKLIVVDDSLNPVFCYKFDGTKIYQPGEVDIHIDYDTSDKFNSFGDIKVFTTLSRDNWDMEITLGAYMNGKNYTEYYLYAINDNSVASHVKTFIDGDCAYFSILPNQKYALSDQKGLNKNAAFIKLLDLDVNDTSSDVSDMITEDTNSNSEELISDMNNDLQDGVDNNTHSELINKLSRTPVILLLIIIFASAITAAILIINISSYKKTDKG